VDGINLIVAGEHHLGLAKRMREVMERDNRCPP
jgi:hypothetical protein